MKWAWVDSQGGKWLLRYKRHEDRGAAYLAIHDNGKGRPYSLLGGLRDCAILNHRVPVPDLAALLSFVTDGELPEGAQVVEE